MTTKHEAFMTRKPREIRSRKRILQDAREARLLATKRRLDSNEIGKDSALCPSCGTSHGTFLRLKTRDSLRCGWCGFRAPVLVFLREQHKEWLRHHGHSRKYIKVWDGKKKALCIILECDYIDPLLKELTELLGN